MDLFVTQSLKHVLIVLSIVAVILSFAKNEAGNGGVPSPLDRRSESQPRNAVKMQFPKNDMLIGLHDPFFWFLAPAFAIIATGITVVLNYMLMIVLHVTTAIYTPIEKLYNKKPNTQFSANNPRRRIIGTGFLLLFVATIVPYQFAYIVVCIVQLSTCIRALKYAKENVCYFYRLILITTDSIRATETVPVRLGTFTITHTRCSL